MYPIRLDPAYQHYVWGGERIQSYFHREIAPGRYAESWEVSDRNEGMSVVANGPWKGKTLNDILLIGKEKIVGKGKSWDPFPLLLKVIDSKEHLSLQVHPDEEASQRLGGQSKSEMWIALEKSSVYVGLKEGVTRADFIQGIDEGKVEHLLRKIDLEKGESIYIPAGQVHSICAGALLLEVQQNSNTTYRLYDWGRKGRELHLEAGLSSINFEKSQPSKIEPRFAQTDGHHRLESIISNSYFIVERLEIGDRWQMKSHVKSCQILFCIRGKAVIEDEPILPGMTYLIPAFLPSVSIHGHCELIVLRFP